MRQPPGSRQGTARQGPINMSGVGQTANMNISDRPVTQQGLSGMRTAGMGPSRQIQDNSYYLQLLRAKTAEISREIGVLRGTIEQGQKDNQAYGQLERKYEALTNDMRMLQGQLTDFKLLLDRTRVHKEAHDVLREAESLAQQNASERQRLDEVFNHRNALEGQAREVEGQLHEMNQRMAERLDRVDPAMKENFLKLQQRHQKLAMHELPKKQADLHFFNERCAEMEQAISRDPSRAKAAQLKDQIVHLERKHQAMSEELDGPQLSIPEQREALLQRVKADNAEIAETERRLKEASEVVQRGRLQLAQAKSDSSE